MDNDEGPLYGDCPTVEFSVEVAASPATLWELVTDINLPARFSSEFKGAEWLDADAGLRVGAQFVGRSQHDAFGSWETTCTVVDLEHERRFGYEVGDLSMPSAGWRFTLEPVDARRTVLTQWMRMGPGRSGLSFAIDRMPEKERRIVRRRLSEFQENMRVTCEGVRDIAERSRNGSAAPA